MQDHRVSVLAGAAIAAMASLLLASCDNNKTATTASAGNAPLPEGVPDIQGTWWATTYSPKIQVMGGGDPPLNSEGMAQYAINKAGLKDGSIVDKARIVCIPDGVPRLLETPYPFEIFQVPEGQITMLHELNHQYRIIPLNEPMKSYDELEPFENYNGYSSGHYEGDTVVIETNGYVADTFLDSTGLPHSDHMVTTERIRKINDNQLEDLITISDPVLYTSNWQARFIYDLRNDIRIEDYSCNDETHRDLSDVQGVAEARALRAEERLYD